MKDSVLSGRLRISDAFWKAILYIARTGNPWRDMPREFGGWNAAYNRFRRWEKSGLWKRIWRHLQSLDDKPLRSLFIDSTTVRAHQHASVAKKAGGQAKQAMGRSCGGLTTKLHAACADDRSAVSFSLSPGQSHDATAFPAV